jgi:SAM-dependent methyltransferase
MKLHIGCGTIYLKDYINIDGAPTYLSKNCDPKIIEQNITTINNYYKQEFCTLPGFVVADLEHQLKEPLPFSDNSIEEVVMYQVLEHIPFYDLNCVLSEISRVLISNGAFLVSVPDIKKTAELLVNAKNEKEEDWAIRLIHGTQKNQWSHHFCGYVLRTLKDLLIKYNFITFEELPSINFYPVIHLKALKG